MIKYATIFIAILSLGCTTAQKDYSNANSEPLPSVEVDEVRTGFENVKAPSISQIIIPSVAQHVLTVDPYPSVVIIKKLHKEISPPNKKQMASIAGEQTSLLHTKTRIRGSTVSAWRDFCGGKKLTAREEDVVSETNIPVKLKDLPCNPVWDGEK